MPVFYGFRGIIYACIAFQTISIKELAQLTSLSYKDPFAGKEKSHAEGK